MIKQNVIFVTDIGKDVDDVLALSILCKLHKFNKINLIGIVINCGNVKTLVKRAKLTRNVLSQFDLEIPICFDVNEKVFNNIGVEQNAFNASPIPFNSKHKFKYIYKDISIFFDKILSCVEDKSVTIDICAPFAEIAKYLSINPSLFSKKVNDVYIMGNLITGSKCELDTNSYNIMLDKNSANISFDFFQKHDILSYFLPSYTIKTKGVDLKYIKDLGNIHPVFKNLYKQQKKAYKRHYLHAKNNQNLDKDKYDLARFLKNFTDLNVVRRYKYFTVWKHITNVYLYDPYTVLLSIPYYKKELFNIMTFNSVHLCEIKTSAQPQKTVLEILKNK